jgi:hypothetical protein
VPQKHQKSQALVSKPVCQQIFCFFAGEGSDKWLLEKFLASEC